MVYIIATVVFLCMCVQYGVEGIAPQTITEEDEIKHLKQTIESLGRQLMTQQLFVEEKIRTDGDSGITNIMLEKEGARPFISDSYTSKTPINMVDNYVTDKIMSVGPFKAVMNGVNFQVPKTYFSLKQPSIKTKIYNKLEDIPFPEVPPSVKSKSTVMEQIQEMRQYFKAFQTQNTHIRADYEKYFKPVLCYLEAGWTRDVTSRDTSSHFHKAATWFDSTKNLRYTINSGENGNSLLSNFHPIKIIDIKDGLPEYIRWDYRVACHPIKYNLRRADLVLIDDLSVRLSKFKRYAEFAMSPAARFRVSGRHGVKYSSVSGSGHEADRLYSMEILDYIMQEIPGKDNYPGYLSDESFKLIHDNMAFANKTRLNTAYYHRMYKVERKDAMGGFVVHRGFTDNNLWAAQTSNPNIAEMKAQDCGYSKTLHKTVCSEVRARYTYAIPLEIIWTTPLLKWNPYDLKFIPGHWLHSPANTVTANGRNGGYSMTKAFNGTNDHRYFLTPYEFFFGGVVGNNTRHGHGVLDQQGILRSVFPSGTRMLTYVPGVGTVRLRYPIMPIHDEGNTIFKELDVLKEMTMNIPIFKRYFETNPSQPTYEVHPGILRNEQFQLSKTYMDPPGMHSHDVDITPEQMMALYKNSSVTVFTSMNNEHQHLIDILIDSHGHYVITSCDGQPDCWDGHSHRLFHQASP